MRSALVDTVRSTHSHGKAVDTRTLNELGSLLGMREARIARRLVLDALAHMTDRWAKYHMNVCGPVALDLAVSPEACRHKHYSAPGAGMADILLVPNYEVGNGIGKAASLFGGAKNAGVILGAKVPIVLVSRSDSAYSKLASIAAGSVLSRRMHLS